eukprot:TRINITY_DN100452_c0_g1_i1.p1 TRINITY_DN100452_c0_g1~~TRINITY_DN100452_c0_g1_i1.p1  ORF type:complete len:346 (-),score=51.37 TRINITY_DN100452_c0_g1_i1:7-1044(-)
MGDVNAFGVPEPFAIRQFQRTGQIRASFPSAPLWVVSACANEAYNLDLEGTAALYATKYKPLEELMMAERQQLVATLAEQLPAAPDADGVDQVRKPRAKKSRLQGGVGAKQAQPKETQPARPSPWSLLSDSGIGKLPDHVRIRPGLVLLQRAVPLQVQQQFTDVTFGLATPPPGQHGGWYRADETGDRHLNNGDFGYYLEHVSTFPKQYFEMCNHFLALANELSPGDFPEMKPSVVLVNYYPQTSKGIWWHRDNSAREKKSAAQGSPVISFSFGDSCDFAFKDEHQDPEKVVCLNSGDVLIFGGPSRMILHAVTKFYPNTAPKQLKMPQPGRLNLTFRQQDMNHE